MKQTAFLFSGQGAQYEGMGQTLAAASSAAKAVYDEAAAVLGLDILNMDGAALQDTRYAQLATFCLSLAAYRALENACQNQGIELDAKALAGFSLGEYAALTVGGAMSFAEALKLIQYRADVMSEAGRETDGAMYAIIGLDDAAIIEILNQPPYAALVLPANFNSPGQLVIAGESEPTAAAAEALLAAGAKRAIRLNVSGAFHTRLMSSAAEKLEAHAQGFTFNQPSSTIYSNVSAQALGGDIGFPAYFAKHMLSPVRWTDTVAAMKNAGIEQYIEFGPAKTLIGLVKRQDRQTVLLNVEDPQSLEATLKALVTEV